MPSSMAMRRARTSVSGGVGGRSHILKSGWNAVKCTGTSGSSCRATAVAAISNLYNRQHDNLAAKATGENIAFAPFFPSAGSPHCSPCCGLAE